MKKQQLKSQQTKKDISAAAIELFSEKGYEKTSVSDIVQKSGFSIGAFYGHFSSKQELASTVWKDIMIRDICESVEIGSTITDKSIFIDYLVAHAEGVAKDAVLDKLNNHISLTPEMQNEISHYAMRYLCMIRDAIKRWNPDMPEDVVWTCASAIHCLVSKYSQRRRSVDFVRITEEGLKLLIHKLIELDCLDC